jgi:uncharacterized membrane protein YagU involved in acid resistance
MGDLTKGFEAGLIATVIISVLLYAQQVAGIHPDFNLISLIQSAASMPGELVMPWIIHFIVGSVFWGLGFAVFSPHLPGPHWLRGAIFGTLAWLVMMLVFLPAAGLPVFAQGMGLEIPATAFALHLVFGLVLGEAYHLLVHYFPGEVEEEKA